MENKTMLVKVTIFVLQILSSKYVFYGYTKLVYDYFKSFHFKYKFFMHLKFTKENMGQFYTLGP